MEKHCTNCEGFAYWDNDFCCVTKMALIEQSNNGLFWCPFPQPHQKKFFADTCKEYKFSEHVYEHYGKHYNEFLDIIKKNGDENLSVEDYYNKYYLV